MMLIFAFFEDMLAASFSGAILILESIPIIFVIALAFTLLTELIEEHYEYGRQPLEKIIDKTFAHLRKHKIEPTYENVKKHMKRHARMYRKKTLHK